jgi:hypothetical protein
VIFKVNVAGVPEPASAVLLVLGAGMLLGRNRKPRRDPAH